MHRVAHCILLLSVSTVLALPSSPLGSIRPCVRTRSCRDGSWPKVATPQATSTPNDDRALNSSSRKGQYHRELSASGKEHANSSSRPNHTVASTGERRNRTTGRTNPRMRLGSRLNSWRLRMSRVNGKVVPCRRPLRIHHVKTNASSDGERRNWQRSSQRKPGHQVWRQNATHKERQFGHITGKHSGSGLHSDGSPRRKQTGDSRRLPSASNVTLHGAERAKNRSSSLADYYRVVNVTRAEPFPSSPPTSSNSLRRTRRSASGRDTSSSEEDSRAIWSSVSRSRPQVYKYWRGPKRPYRQTHYVAVRPSPQAERVVPVRIYQTRYPAFVGTHVSPSRPVVVRFPQSQVFDVQLERQRRRAGAERDFEELNPELLHSSSEERLLGPHQPFSQANAILMGYSAPSRTAYIGEPPSVLYRPRHRTKYSMLALSDPSEEADGSSSEESSEESSNEDSEELRRAPSQSISEQQEERTQLPYTSSLVARLLADHAEPKQLLRDLQHELVASDQRARSNSNPRTSEVDQSDDLDSKLSSESKSKSESESDENTEKSAESSSTSSSSEEDDTRKSEPDADSAVEDLSDAEFELKKESHKRNIRERSVRYADDRGSRETDGKHGTIIDRWLRQLLLREGTRKGTRRVNLRSDSGDAEEESNESDSSSDSSSSSSEEESSNEALTLARRADAGSRADEIMSREADSLPSEGFFGSARSRDWSASEGETSSSESSSSEEEHANTKRALREELSEEQSDDEDSVSDEEDRSSSSSEEGSERTKRTRRLKEPHLASQLASLDRLARALVH